MTSSGSSDSDLILSKLVELTKHYLDDENPPSELVVKLFRLLRISSVSERFHDQAVKQKLKQYIVSTATTNSPENASLLRFNKKLDFMIQSNPKILNSFLLVLEPFCGMQQKVHHHSTSSFLSGLNQIPIHKSRFDSIDYVKNSLKTLQLDPIDSGDSRKQQQQQVIDKQSEIEVIRSLLYIFQVCDLHNDDWL
jgi:hypothetical protein